jgi:hypothetical protein
VATTSSTHSTPPTKYPLTFHLYEKQDEDNQDHDTKYNLSRELVTELEDEVGVPADTYLFDSWFTIPAFPNTSNPTARIGWVCSGAIVR